VKKKGRKGVGKERRKGDGKGRNGSLLDLFANFYGYTIRTRQLVMLQNALKLTYGHPVESKF